MRKQLVAFSILCFAIVLPAASLPRSHGQGADKQKPKTRGDLISQIQINDTDAVEEATYVVDPGIKVRAKVVDYETKKPFGVWVETYPGYDPSVIPEFPSGEPTGVEDPMNASFWTAENVGVGTSATGEETTLVIWTKYIVTASPESQSLYARHTLKFVAKSTSRAATYGSYPLPERRTFFRWLRRCR